MRSRNRVSSTVGSESGRAPLGVLRALLGGVLLAVCGSLGGNNPAWGWVRSTQPDRPPGLAQPEPLIRSARDLLRLFGMNDERLAEVLDGSPEIVTAAAQQELLLRMLMSCRRFTGGDLSRYAQSVPEAGWSTALPQQRGELYVLRGTVRQVTPVTVESDLAARFEIQRYYRCEVELADGQRAVIDAFSVPAEWRERGSAEPLDARIGASGFLLRRVQLDAQPQLEFVTQRLAWYPPGPLGDLDGDAGLFETVRNGVPLEESDTASFYELLAACGRVTSQQLLRLAPESFPIVNLFPRRDKQKNKLLEPQIERGELIRLTGTAQRAVKIMIEDPDKVAAYGLDHYFEIEVWHADALGNPITFCVRKLPPGMPTGERIAVDVVIAGFFLKTWAYRINKIHETSNEKTRYQIAPLLIGREPLLVPREPPSLLWQLAGGLLFAVAVIGAWFGVAWSQREDKKFHDRVVRRVVDAAEDAPTLAGLDQLEYGERGFHDYHEQAPLLKQPGETLPQIDTTPRPAADDTTFRHER